MFARSRIPRGLLAAAFMLTLAAPLAAQDTTITEDLATRLLDALKAEKTGIDGLGDALAEVDAKIKKFNDCKELFEAAGSETGKLGGLAAKIAMKAKCGATNADGFYKERQKLTAGPQQAALDILKMKAGAYGKLKERIGGFLAGTSNEFSSAEVAILNKYKKNFSDLMPAMAYAARGGEDRGTRGGSRGGRSMNANWSSPDYAWQYIGSMFNIMYMSGAPLFEKPYAPGDWTRWQLTQSDAQYDDTPVQQQKTVFERAFLSKDAEGKEWWRTTQIDNYDDGGTQKADTVILEALYKNDNEYIKQLVRMKGKFPGQAEAQELMVPQAFAMLSSLSAFGMKPTEESVKGATVGTETVGKFSARHVKFGGGNGASEWWLADDAPGVWVRFQHIDTNDKDAKKPASYVMELVDHGKGAKSILGVQ
jgi:hypothetical protein